jgi:hypothetical protein
MHRFLTVSQVRVAAIALAVLVAIPAFASAHHGWRWATDEEFEITGEVTATNLGEPHGQVVIVTEEGDEWLIQVGQPWRNRRAGLSNELLAEGTVITVHGHRSAREDELVVKAERVEIDEESYILYPDREM